MEFAGVRDLYQRARTSTSGSSASELQELSAEGGGEISRKKICTNFLQSIDQTGQYEPLYFSSIFDPVKNERAHRLNVMTQVGCEFQTFTKNNNKIKSMRRLRSKVTAFSIGRNCLSFS